MENLKQIESELLDLLAKDKSNWVQIYRLMNDVYEHQELIDTSYTQWVNELASRAKVHVSLLWSRKKAGEAYDKYAQRASECGISVPALEDINVSPDNINLVTKIAGKNSNVADDLMQKVADGQLHRTDLKETWQEVKEERVSKGFYPVRTSRHSLEDEGTEKATDTITAKSILYAIQHDSSWIGCEVEDNRNCYKVIPELAVRPGTSRHARRIDIAVFEDATNAISHSHGITVHAIEVKVDKNDLLNDQKMSEYTDYADYFWLAIPKELLKYAEEYVLDTWGIIVFENGEVYAHKKAQKLDAVMREDVLSEAVKRLK